ncbi:MAG: hypothetical protein JW702_10705 [Clostridiales bacterium]|nr:hypothetical protein [Clostridiales bacterium]
MLGKEEKIALSHIEDMIERSIDNHMIAFTDFVLPALWTELNKKLIEDSFIIKKIQLNLYCEYAILAVYPSYMSISEKDIPIKVLKMTILDQTVITHRDVLGAVLNLGIKREKIGDIFVKENIVYMMAIDKMVEFIKTYLLRIKNSRISIEEVLYNQISDFKPNYKEKMVTGNSLRFDLILSKVFNLSRSDVQQYFKNNKVKRNHIITENYKKDLNIGDIVSLRGHGRFQLIELIGTTKKGNTQVKVHLFY